MEPKLFLPSPRTSPSIASVPFFLSYKSPLFANPKLSSKTHIFLSTKASEKTQFLGKSLNLQKKIVPLGNVEKTHIRSGLIRAAVKRRKELPFDNVIQRDKKLKLVLKIQKILVSQPDRVMSLRDLGRYRRALGLQKRRRFIALLRKFPAIFEIVEEGVYSLQFKLTPEAERLYLEEMRIRNEMEGLLVIKLRKLLMMSSEKRILLEKIAHLKTDFGLPLEFRDTICHRYPQYFRVVSTGRGPALELTHWDPELAVSAAELAEEENQTRELEEKDLIIDRPLKFNRVKLPRGLNLSKGEMRRICQFRDMPYISPYSDFSAIRSGTLEKEKHACGVVHEILSLTVEKRTLVDHLTHFREEFRDSVFLREACRDSHLIEKDRLLLIKEKLGHLLLFHDFQEGEVPKLMEMEWRKVMSGQKEVVERMKMIDGEDYEDDWSDEDDDEVPPDFDEDGGNVKIGLSKSTKKVESVTENEEKVLLPMYPDGRPRTLVKVVGIEERPGSPVLGYTCLKAINILLLDCIRRGVLSSYMKMQFHTWIFSALYISPGSSLSGLRFLSMTTRNKTCVAVISISFSMFLSCTSPEACAAILWKSSQAAPKAAEKLKITAQEHYRVRIADGIIPVAIDANGQSKGYGFVQFDQEEAAQNAIKRLNGMLMNDKQVYVGLFVRRQERNRVNGSPKFTNIYVKIFSETTTDEDLMKFFGKYGPITSAVVTRDANGKSRCFGFVNFQNPDDAAAAVENLNGSSLNDDKVLFVGKAQRKAEREAELKAKFEQERNSRFEKLQGANLYLKNLDDIVTDEKLKELFSEFGTITSCKIMLDLQGVVLVLWPSQPPWKLQEL
ncbi:hypothetical protein LOK49_LG02G00155 [Camellia lanceoleosa]|uniref:Uncharacterized protein n=1 Tax=Camellia lanceoleosa TaxID=1840588 RepID=A0ACC0ISA7_9ERIC|nr:hypothetical protein LOK49_LG02G00155 [Camellia lanceoleosa]